jgi:stress response protein SCP2
MEFKIEKGGRFNIEKALSHILVGLGWDAAKVAPPIDIDGHAFGCVNINGAPRFYDNGSHAVTYAAKDGLKRSGSKFGTSDDAIIHYGDNLTGNGDGDDEQIEINFDKLPKEINDVAIFVTIHEAKKRGQHFGMVDNAFLHLTNRDTGEELARYNLKNEFNGHVTIQIGSFVKNDDKWSFVAVGAGTADQGLMDVINSLL